MKPFESFLAPMLEEYLDYRQSLGFRQSVRYSLRLLDRYVHEQRATREMFTPQFFLRFREQLPLGPRSVNGVLTGVRGFFDFLLRRELVAINPLVDIPPCRQNAYIPFVFSPEQIEQLLTCLQERIRQNEKHFFNDMTVYTTLLLQSRCGLRISEPLRMRLQHYRFKERSLYIEKTKFSKDRLIPAPQAAAAHLENYLGLRSRFAEKGNTFLLPGPGQRRLRPNRIYPVFKKAVQAIGIHQPRRTIANTTFGAPTPHSLRHSFAVNTLLRCRQRGMNLRHVLPILSAYMGHRKYSYTALYLKVVEAGQRQALVDFSIERKGDL